MWTYVDFEIDLNLVFVCTNTNTDLGLKGSRGLGSFWKYKVLNATVQRL